MDTENSSITVDPSSNLMDHTIPNGTVEGVTRVYRYRFVILALFCLYSLVNAFGWIEYSIIHEIIKNHYGVSDVAVNWTAMLYSVSYIPLIFPATWLMEKKGLRFVIIIGSLGTALGSWIKVFSVNPDQFWLTMIGQGIVACSQIFILSVPPRLAAVWFSPEEVSRACAVGVFGNQVGISLGFVIPPLIVPNSKNPLEVADGMRKLFYVVAGCTSAVFLAVLIGFKDKPLLPPNKAQISQNKTPNYIATLKSLVCNGPYVLLLVSYGINVGVFYAISTLLSQVVSKYFPNQESTVGLMGLSLVLTGMAGSVICGILLDKTKKFKEVTLSIYILSTLLMFVYTFILQAKTLALVFVTTSCLGFFMTGYLPIGFEFASELTYPEPEGTSSGLLNAAAQLFGILFTMGASEIDIRFGDVPANVVLSATMIIGSIMTVLIKSDLRRQRAFDGVLGTKSSSSSI